MGVLSAPFNMMGSMLGFNKRPGTESKPVEGPKEIDKDTLAECYKYGLLAYTAYADSVDEAQAFLKEINLPTTPEYLTMGGLIQDGNMKLLRYETTDTEAVVVKMKSESGNGYELVIAFRGTETTWNKGMVSDALSDLWLVKVNVSALEGLSGRRADLRECEVHSGFLKALNSALKGTKATKSLPAVIKELFPAGEEPTRIVVTGHSLGGALCTLAAFWCKTVAFPDKEVKCFAFASPRVGNPGFVAKFNELIGNNQNGCYRFTHKDDVVPAVPPYFWGFDHVSNAVFLLEPHKKNYKGLAFDWSEKVDKSVKKYAALLAMRPVAAYTSAGDHDMGKYLSGIGNVLGLEALTQKAEELRASIDAREKDLLSGVHKMAVKTANDGEDPAPSEALTPAPVPAPATAVAGPAMADLLVGTGTPVVAATAMEVK